MTPNNGAATQVSDVVVVDEVISEHAYCHNNCTQESELCYHYHTISTTSINPL